jgi:hypothetical protein
MLELKKELEAEIKECREYYKTLKEEAVKEELKFEYTIGTSNISVRGISDRQLVYTLSIMKSRLNGAKLIEDLKPELVEQCRKDIEQFKAALAYQEKIRANNKILCEDEDLLYDVEELLNPSERRELLTLKIKDIKIERNK